MRLTSGAVAGLVAFDVVAAVFWSLIATGVRDLDHASSSVASGGIRSLPINVAIAAGLLAVPYVRYVARSQRGLIRRAALGGVAYAIVVVAVTLLVGVVTGANPVDGSLLAPAWLVGQIGVFVALTLPFTLIGGLLTGAIHGLLTRWLARSSANAPIVAS